MEEKEENAVEEENEVEGRKSLQRMGPSLSNVDLSNDPGPPTELERVRERGREREREREREVEYIT